MFRIDFFFCTRHSLFAAKREKSGADLEAQLLTESRGLPLKTLKIIAAADCVLNNFYVDTGRNLNKS